MDTKRITDIPGMMYLWQVDNLLLAGQPHPSSFEHIKNLGVTKIINVRNEAEMDFSGDKEIASSLDMEYEQFPICVNGVLSPDNCKRLSEMLDEDKTHFIHCGSANRVGGWLITYLTQYRKMDFDDAVMIAQGNGLSNPGFIDQAEEIIDSNK